MTPAERAAYAAGLRDAADLARIAAISLEVRADRDQVRQRAAVAALYGLAEGIATLAPADPVAGASAQEPGPVRQALRIIADQPGPSGEIECPRCAGRLRWTRAETNGHVWGACENGDVSWMQ